MFLGRFHQIKVLNITVTVSFIGIIADESASALEMT